MIDQALSHFVGALSDIFGEDPSDVLLNLPPGLDGESPSLRTVVPAVYSSEVAVNWRAQAGDDLGHYGRYEGQR